MLSDVDLFTNDVADWVNSSTEVNTEEKDEVVELKPKQLLSYLAIHSNIVVYTFQSHLWI